MYEASETKALTGEDLGLEFIFGFFLRLMNDALTGEHFKFCCTCDNNNKDLFYMSDDSSVRSHLATWQNAW